MKKFLTALWIISGILLAGSENNCFWFWPNWLGMAMIAAAGIVYHRRINKAAEPGRRPRVK